MYLFIAGVMEVGIDGISLGKLVNQAKGKDRSLREYARDSGVDAAIIS